MPIVLLIVVGFVVFALLSRAKAGEDEQLSAPPLVQAQTNTLAHGNNGKNGNAIGQVLNQLGQYMGGALATSEAKVVWNIGVALGVAIGTINVVIGIVVFVVVATIAAFINVFGVLSDGRDDQHQMGIDTFEEDWLKAYTANRNRLEDHALAQSGGVPLSASDLDTLDVVCSAYADGFMQRTNYYRCTQCLWGIGSSANSVYAGWMNGSYASYSPPRMTALGYAEALATPEGASLIALDATSREAFEYTFAPPLGNSYARMQAGRRGLKVFQLDSPVPLTYVPGGQWHEPGWGRPPSTDPLINAWGRLGTAHADAAAVKRAQQVANAGGIRLDVHGSNNAKMNALCENGMWMGELTSDGPFQYGMRFDGKRYHWNMPMNGHHDINGAAPIFTEIA